MEEEWSYNQSIKLLQQQLKRCLTQGYRGAQNSHSLTVGTKDNCLWITNKSKAGKSEIDWLLGVDSVCPLEALAYKGVAEYWLLDTRQVELTVYRDPIDVGYQKQRCFYVGSLVSPIHFPSLMLEIQEPLPLHFLTRTAVGVKVDRVPRLPLTLIL